MAEVQSEAVLIWSGEHHAYWRPNSAGYTIDGLAAGVYPRDQAERIARGCDPEKKIELREIPANSPVLAAIAAHDSALRDRLAEVEAENARLREVLHQIGRSKGKFSRASGLHETAEHALRAVKAFARAALTESKQP